MRNLIVGFGLGLLILVRSVSSQAEESRPEARVEQLEKVVRELEGRLSAIEEKQEEPGTFRAYWKEGLRFDSADGVFKLKVGGRIHNDWAFFYQDSELESQIGNMQDGTEFRRARFYISGTVYEQVEFKAEYDFAGGDADFKDVYLGLNKLPVLGNMRVGHFKEPFSLEELTNDNYITFMERGLPNALVPSRNTGIVLHNHELDERVTWAVGVFRDTDGYGDGSGDGEYNVTARVTGLPIYEDEGRTLAHLGVAYSYRNVDDTLRFRERPESHLADRFVDTGEFAADDLHLLGAEAALVHGQGSVQAEYVQAMLDRDDGPDTDFFGYYVHASYFLTGEHRRYKPSNAAFDRVKPKKNFRGKERGFGAWEIAARYSHLDLDDASISGGDLDTITAALNWYLNPNTRVMLNYAFADPYEKYTGEANIFQMRFQIDF